MKIPPDANGYRAKDGVTAVATQLDGGDPRVRGDQLGAAKTVDVQWTTSPAGFDYLEAFYRTAAGANGVPGCLPFQVNLVGIDGSESQLYTCRFVPGTFGLISQSGLAYVVGAQLWVKPLPPTTDADNTLMAAYVA
jgi:hypothetical protein